MRWCLKYLSYDCTVVAAMHGATYTWSTSCFLAGCSVVLFMVRLACFPGGCIRCAMYRCLGVFVACGLCLCRSGSWGHKLYPMHRFDVFVASTLCSVHFVRLPGFV